MSTEQVHQTKTTTLHQLTRKLRFNVCALQPPYHRSFILCNDQTQKTLHLFFWVRHFLFFLIFFCSSFSSTPLFAKEATESILFSFPRFEFKFTVFWGNKLKGNRSLNPPSSIPTSPQKKINKIRFFFFFAMHKISLEALTYIVGNESGYWLIRFDGCDQIWWRRECDLMIMNWSLRWRHEREPCFGSSSWRSSNDWRWWCWPKRQRS